MGFSSSFSSLTPSPQESIPVPERRCAPTATQEGSAATGHPRAPSAAKGNTAPQEREAALTAAPERISQTTELMMITTIAVQTVVIALPESTAPLVRLPVATAAQELTQWKERAPVLPARW